MPHRGETRNGGSEFLGGVTSTLQTDTTVGGFKASIVKTFDKFFLFSLIYAKNTLLKSHSSGVKPWLR